MKLKGIKQREGLFRPDGSRRTSAKINSIRKIEALPKGYYLHLFTYYSTLPDKKGNLELDISRILIITVCEMVLVLEVISTEVTILGWGRGHP